MFNDDVVDAGEAFLGQGISDGGGIGNVQLWNPAGTGKILYLDRVIVAGESNVGADIRYTNAPLPGMDSDPHVRNKCITGAAPKAQVRHMAGTAPNSYPFNRPVQEVWLGGTNNDRTYSFAPAIKIPQGYGVCVSMAGVSKCLASFQWREKTDPNGASNPPPPPPPPSSGTLIAGSEGTVHTDMVNGSNAFDTDESTYAIDNTTTNFYIGKIWAATRSVSRFVIKSTPTRSFSGANPGRVLTWALETYNGTAWTQATTGTYTEPGTGATQSVIDVSFTASALGHRVRLSESAVAAHRVGLLEFYA